MIVKLAFLRTEMHKLETMSKIYDLNMLNIIDINDMFPIKERGDLQSYKFLLIKRHCFRIPDERSSTFYCQILHLSSTPRNTSLMNSENTTWAITT